MLFFDPTLTGATQLEKLRVARFAAVTGAVEVPYRCLLH